MKKNNIKFFTNLIALLVSFFTAFWVKPWLFKLFAFFSIGFVTLLIITIIQQENPEKTYYEFEEEKIDSPVRIVFISDLHLRQFGTDNEKLISLIKAEKPDVIMLGGDFNQRSAKDYSAAIRLLPALAEIAPTYYTLGNHELMHSDCEKIIDEIRESGVVLLDNEIDEIELNGNKITVCGLNLFTHVEYEDEVYGAFTGLMERFSASVNYKILLCHYPHYSQWYFEKSEFSYDFDLMLSGHTHGGGVRLPFIGGLIAPEQGLFPKYDYGLFEPANYKLLITSGLGDTHYWARFNNPPEIMVIDLKSID